MSDGEAHPLSGEVNPRTHGVTVQALMMIVRRGDYSDIGPRDDIAEPHFDEADIGDDTVVGSQRVVQVRSGQTDCEIRFTTFNEAIGTVRWANEEEHGPLLATMSITTQEEDVTHEGGIHGVVDVYQNPYVDYDFAHGTVYADDPHRQTELNRILESLGLDDSVMVHGVNKDYQASHYNDDQLARFNGLLADIATSDAAVFEL